MAVTADAVGIVERGELVSALQAIRDRIALLGTGDRRTSDGYRPGFIGQRFREVGLPG